jgi:hypothetical protein
MQRIVWLAGLALLLAWGAAARASDPLGAYAVADKVVLEPSEGSPTQIQIWGTFVLNQKGGRTHTAPAYGYLYYKLDSDNAEACRKEWADWKKEAGTGSVIGFGSNYNLGKLGKVHPAAEKPENPAVYPLGNGLVKIPDGANFNAAVQELLSSAVPVTPAANEAVAPGAVTLVARNVLLKDHAKAKYVFELENGAGEKEVSPALDAGEKETKWQPRMEVKAGEKYTWRVRVSDAGLKGTVATSTFQGKPRP